MNKLWVAIATLALGFALVVGSWLWVFQSGALDQLCSGPSAASLRFCWDYQLIKQSRGE